MAYILIIIMWHGLDAPVATARFADRNACDAAKFAVMEEIKKHNQYLEPFVECFLERTP